MCYLFCYVDREPYSLWVFGDLETSITPQITVCFGDIPSSTALPCTAIIVTTTNDVYNDNNNCEMPKIDSSQMPKPPQLVPVDREKQIKIPDSKVLIVSKFNKQYFGPWRAFAFGINCYQFAGCFKHRILIKLRHDSLYWISQSRRFQLRAIMASHWRGWSAANRCKPSKQASK